MIAHTCVIGRYQRRDRWPDEDDGDARPRPVDDHAASGDGVEVVASRLNHVVDRHHEERYAEADDQVLDVFPPLQRLRPHDRVVVGEDVGQVPGDGEYRHDDSGVAGHDDLDLDVAVDAALPARVEGLVRRPDEGVDPRAQIVRDQPEDESYCRDVSGPPVPAERHEAEDHRQAARNSEEC